MTLRTLIPFKHLSDDEWDILVFLFENLLFSIVVSLLKLFPNVCSKEYGNCRNSPPFTRIKILRIALWIWHTIRFMKGHLKLRLQSLSVYRTKFKTCDFNEWYNFETFSPLENDLSCYSKYMYWYLKKYT